MKKGSFDPKTLVTIILIMAVVLFAIMIATNAIKPLGDLANSAKITDLLKTFGITGGTK